MLTNKQQKLLMKMYFEVKRRGNNYTYEFTRSELKSIGNYPDKSTLSKALINLEMHFMVAPMRIELPDEIYMRSSHIRRMETERARKALGDDELFEKLRKEYGDDIRVKGFEKGVPTEEEIDEIVRERNRSMTQLKKRYKDAKRGSRLKYSLTHEGIQLAHILMKAEKWKNFNKNKS